MAISKIVANSTGFGSETIGLTMPTGNTAQRPATASLGTLRFNTDGDALENYTSAGWVKVAVKIPTLESITGTIYAGLSTTLTLTGTEFGTSNANVRFTSGETTKDVSVLPISLTSINVATPSEIISLNAGSVVSIRVINGDGGQSGTIDKTVTSPPTGGTITTYDNYRVHSFTTSGTFTVPSGLTLTDVDYLIVAGGGAGGGSSGANGNGGGGAGGMRASSFPSMSAGSYPAVVGGGGTGVNAGSGQTSGTNSSFNSITSTAGGAGASASQAASSGGSGGGGTFSGPNQSGAPGTPGQGNSGGSGNFPADGRGGGGGGGAGAVGGNATGLHPASQAGAGGAGSSNSIRTGSAVFYAGGGGGSVADQPSGGGAGGNGGGGTGSAQQPGGALGSNGSPNTGGGGGAGRDIAGYNGGSGIVVVRYQI
jgi:hypothetical protein